MRGRKAYFETNDGQFYVLVKIDNAAKISVFPNGVRRSGSDPEDRGVGDSFTANEIDSLPLHTTVKFKKGAK
tara:strand:+ start:521 stop:736 length:216 start_codon:yes stop_codon:yes gene_type:complete